MKDFDLLAQLSPNLEYGRFRPRRRVLRHYKIIALVVLLFVFVVRSVFYMRHHFMHNPDITVVDVSHKQAENVPATIITTESLTHVIDQDEQDDAPTGGQKLQVQQADNQLQIANEWFSKGSDFEASLARVVDILPGEMEMRELLQPISGSGAHKLREIGLRARQYSKFLSAWEDLHFLQLPDGTAAMRPDMIHYIRHYYSKHTLKIPGTGTYGVIHSYEAYKAFMSKFGQLIADWTTPYFADHMSLHLKLKNAGRGIVLTAGNAQAPHLKTLIASLRDFGCTLPIEVMYLDDGDLDVDLQAEIESIKGVITRQIGPMVSPNGWKLGGWGLKPFAILLSSFREAIFIDADSLFFRNPEQLFDDPDYQKTGALFFRDRSLFPETKKEWLKDLLPRPISSNVLHNKYWRGESGHLQESGVVVVDKWRHFMAMLIVCRMNGPERDGDREKGTVGVYEMVYGDKETFWLGWEMVGDVDYAFHRGSIATMGAIQEVAEEKAPESTPEASSEEPSKEPAGEDEVVDAIAKRHETQTGLATANYTICSPQLLHLDADGHPLWFNGGLLQNKFAEKREWQFVKFEHYLIEPPVVSPSTAKWQLQTNNRMCLTTSGERMRQLRKSDQTKLSIMIENAKVFMEL